MCGFREIRYYHGRETGAFWSQNRVRYQTEGNTVESKKPKNWGGNLSLLEHYGIGLYLEGRPSTPEEIRNVCSVCEDSAYMPDYVMDEEGGLKEIRYDRVTL